MTAKVRSTASVSYDDPEAIHYSEGDRHAFNTIQGETPADADLSVSALVSLDPKDPPDPQLLDVRIDDTDVDVGMEEFHENRQGIDPEPPPPTLVRLDERFLAVSDWLITVHPEPPKMQPHSMNTRSKSCRSA